MSKNNTEKYLILSDLHIPDQNIKILDLMYEFIAYYKPDSLLLLGDFLNFTKISSYAQDPLYTQNLSDEILTGGKILKKLSEVARKANKDCEVIYFQGNHEDRLGRYLASNADQLASLTEDDEYLISVPHLLGLKELNIKYIPYYKALTRHNVVFTHGHLCRSKAGYTAHGNIDKFGISGFSGHTHKLAHIAKTQGDITKFWIETGCLCNLKPTPRYTAFPDWANGFATCTFNNGKAYPQAVPIIKDSFIYDGKMFRE